MKKATRSEKQGSQSQGQNTTKTPYLPPRAWRLVSELISRPEGITREQADRMAPASNGPHYVGLVRHRLNIEIPCLRIPHVTADGDASWHGLYRLTPADRIALHIMGVTA